jgi:uncharacterized protein (TIGR03435 family)
MITPAVATSLPWWAAVGAPLANHLWQATLCAALAGLLTLMLKKNRAQVRYWLWFAASLKFVIPFSLLITLASQWQPAKNPAVTASEFFSMAGEIGQPFASSLASSPAAPATSVARGLTKRMVAVSLLIVWCGGCGAVMIFWWRRWQRVNARIRGVRPATSGREFDALRRLERGASQIALMKSATLEPGIVGIIRPVLVLPEGISDRMTDAQLEAIIAHELSHVRRRDNLAAAVHMLVEAAFWFHPLVWWIGARLVDERERACDEEVLRLGNDPQAYAEGILKVCEFYLESPLVCVAGVTGSNLKNRIEEIMLHRIARKLNLGRKLLLGALGTAVVAGPLVIGLLNPAPSQAQAQAAPAGLSVFESVTITPKGTVLPNQVISQRILRHPDVSTFTNWPVKELIKFAYHVADPRIFGAPDVVGSELYDVTIRTKGPVPEDEFLLEFQRVLAERFTLETHRELRAMPVYELVVGKDGSKLTAWHGGRTNVFLLNRPGLSLRPGPSSTAARTQDDGHDNNTQIVAEGSPMQNLTGFLERETGRPVVDMTRLNGQYDFTLTINSADVSWPRTPESTAALLKAIPEQLGLELVPQTSTVEVLVVDHVEPVTKE